MNDTSPAAPLPSPAVSVIMAVYNGARYLEQALESILNQTFEDFEIIVVDDCSTDASWSICLKYESLDPRVTLLHNENNLGLTRSLNRALRVAKGKYIARMDADDVSLPQRFEKQVEYLDSKAEIGLVGTFYEEIDQEGNVRTNVVQFPSDPIIIQWRMAFENPIPHPPIMVRKELLDLMGGYDERWDASQDYDLFTRLSRITKLGNYPRVLFRWRRHGESVSSTHNDRQRKNALQISRTFICGALRRDVPMELVELLWNRRVDVLEDAVSLCTIGYDLCRRTISESRWSKSERRLLRQYVSRKLFSYLQGHIVRIGTWPLLLHIVFLNPGLVVEQLFGRNRPPAPARTSTAFSE